jgi:hypothetical protein
MTHEGAERWTSGKTINTWVQTAGIFVAAVWGFYTFVFKEKLAPKAAPVNISLNLQLKKIGATGTTKGLTAVEMKISATNPASRQLFLLPSAWIAHVIKMEPVEMNEAEFNEAANSVLGDARNIFPQQRRVRAATSQVVAVGHLFGDKVLKPNETAARTVLFYVPETGYDLVDVIARMPCGADTAGIQLGWNLSEQSLVPTVSRRDRSGQWVPLRVDQNGDFVDKKDKRLELQTAEATAEISL